MVLSDKDIQNLIDSQKLVISPLPKNQDLESASIRLHLAPKILKYKECIHDLKAEGTFESEEIIIGENGYELKPGEFILGSTLEKITIPNGYFGFIETKGNIARAGIQTHNTDGHIDPGFSGNITLEIKNNSNCSIVIYSEIAFVALYIFKMTSKAKHPYRGKYQNQKGATVFRRDF